MTRQHTGMGTAARFFFFDQSCLELIWVEDSQVLQHVAPDFAHTAICYRRFFRQDRRAAREFRLRRARLVVACGVTSVLFYLRFGRRSSRDVDPVPAGEVSSQSKTRIRNACSIPLPGLKFVLPFWLSKRQTSVNR
jgi:hypothetical protein